MRVCVTYEERQVASKRSKAQFGDWYERYESRVTGAFILGEFQAEPYNSEVFQLPDDADTAYVVYMVYDTGDSFGRSTGNIDIVHCTSNEAKAHEIAKKISDNPKTYTIEFIDDFDRNISIYNNGAGYFEHINYIEVVSFSLSKGGYQQRYEPKY